MKPKIVPSEDVSTNQSHPRPGIYRHFKGNFYRLISVAQSSETLESQVVYQALYGNYETWVRPLCMWNETVEFDGNPVKRFEFVDIENFPVAPSTTTTPLPDGQFPIKIDKIALLHLHNKKILMARSRGKDVFYLPGGKREPNEDNLQALTRELKEELNINITPNTTQLYGVYFSPAHRDGSKNTDTWMRMTLYRSNFTGTPTASSEIEEVKYLGYIDRDKTTTCGKIIFDELYQKGLLD